MNVLFRSPVGALLARPWLDAVGLAGLRRWYFPLSRLWAAANAAGEDFSHFSELMGPTPPPLWPAPFVRGLLGRNRRARDAAAAARLAWDRAFAADAGDFGALDRRRRLAATRHLSTRGLFYPLLFPRRMPLARWHIGSREAVERDLVAALADPASLYAPPREPVAFEQSPAFAREGVREYWLRAASPAARLQCRPGSETVYARVVEPVAAPARHTLIFGSGLCLETDLLAIGRDSAGRLAELGWRTIEPVSPYHGLRTMPGTYGGEPFFAEGPIGALDLIAGQTIESAALIGWARRRFGRKVALAGISMTSFVAQQAASHCRDWPEELRPDAVMLISHSGRVEEVTFGGALTATIGLDRALIDAGWSREALARVSRLIDPAPEPGLSPARIVSVLGETDRWVPYEHGLGLARQWRLPESNITRYPLGHLGMPVQLMRDSTPFDRLRRVLDEA